jgi:two-component system NtrC family sensor kinase
VNLTQKLVLYALAVALLPLAASGFTLVRLGEDAMRSRIMAHERTAAVAVASGLERGVSDLGEAVVMVVKALPPAGLRRSERAGLLGLLLQQSSSVAAAVLLDARGEAQGALLSTVAGGVGAPPAEVAAAVSRVRDNLPTLDKILTRPHDPLLGAVYFPAHGPAHAVLAVGCSTQGERARMVVALELVLEAPLLRLEDAGVGDESRVVLLDGLGRVIAHPARLPGTDLSAHAAVQALRLGGASGNVRYPGDGGVWAAAVALVPRLGWGVVVEQPEAVAFADAARMRRRTVSWITATAVVVALTALAFALRLRRRLTGLMVGVRAYSAGRFGERVGVGGPDELGQLADTLNAMAAELERSLAELQAWSRTLEERVDARTRELREAQAQLLLQSKLAAIGQLGAGVAHEVNNPLAGILGYAQLLLRKRPAGDPDQHALERIQEAALRCKTITQNLLRFSQRGVTGRSPVEINGMVTEVLDIVTSGFVEAGLQVVRELGPGAGTVTADAGQLSLVLVNLLSNSRNATGSGGTITVATTGDADHVRITVTDTGHGIEPDHLSRLFDPFFTTKKNWTGVGLGLSVAYRVVADHGGRIEVESKVGEGSRFTVVVPRLPPEATVEATMPRRPSLLA